MTRRASSCALACLVSALLMGVVYADIPEVINYQGKVTGSGGTPVADGTCSMQFSI